jgi:hypothetical protein
LNALFPDALFIHLTRDPRGNIASLYRGWQEPSRYKTYPLPPAFSIGGYDKNRWSFVLQPGWKELAGRPLIDVCAHQWKFCNKACLDDLAKVDPDRVMRISYEDLVSNPVPTLRAIAARASLHPSPYDRFEHGLPIIQATSKPDPDKWRSLQPELERVLPDISDVADQLGYQLPRGS